MKIICKKGYSAKKTLQLVMDYVEKMSLNYPLLANDMEIEISLKGMDEEICPDNTKTIYISQNEMKLLQNMDDHADYYNTDALTGLYNRNKYEHDFNIFQTIGYKSMICIYIDAVGLHEINNHLGHQAGDYMLCSIANGIQKYFPDSLSYRIGGDEFVILCVEQIQQKVEDKVTELKQEIRGQEYEISVGIASSTDKKTLNDIYDQLCGKCHAS